MIQLIRILELFRFSSTEYASIHQQIQVASGGAIGAYVRDVTMFFQDTMIQLIRILELFRFSSTEYASIHQQIQVASGGAIGAYVRDVTMFFQDISTYSIWINLSGTIIMLAPNRSNCNW